MDQGAVAPDLFLEDGNADKETEKLNQARTFVSSNCSEEKKTDENSQLYTTSESANPTPLCFRGRKATVTYYTSGAVNESQSPVDNDLRWLKTL